MNFQRPADTGNLKLRGEIIKLGATHTLLDKGIFIMYKSNRPIGIMTYFANDALWEVETEYENTLNLLHKLCTQAEIFYYIGIKLKQNSDFPYPRMIKNNRV